MRVYTANGPVYKDNQKCALCNGDGKGKYRGICTRCGGYGSFSKKAPNPSKVTKEEIGRERI